MPKQMYDLKPNEDGVDVVDHPATGRPFLIVGEDDEVTTFTAGTETEVSTNKNSDVRFHLHSGHLMSLVALLQQALATAPKSVQNALKVLADFIGSGKPEDSDRDDKSPASSDAYGYGEYVYGYPPPKRASILAAAFPVKSPKKEWFQDPKLSGPTPLTVTDEGRVYGHIATWGTCHVGIEDSCVMPPRSASGYAFFRTGVVRIDGEDIPVGQITMGTGHADISASAQAAAAHYDNTGTAVADVACGEDEYGIWVSGALRKGTTLEQVHALRASAPSGDWRVIAGNYELVGILAVNVPGFPVPRTLAASAFGYDKDGKLITILATGSQGTDPRVVEWIQTIESRLASLEKTAKILRPVAIEHIRNKVARSDID